MMMMMNMTIRTPRYEKAHIPPSLSFIFPAKIPPSKVL